MKIMRGPDGISVIELWGMRLDIYLQPKMRIYPNFTIWYSEKGGRPVLKEERSWTKISRFMIRTKTSKSYSFQFRRVFRF